VDGGKPFHRRAHRTLWRGAIDGRDRILSPPAGKHSHAGEGSIVKDALGRDWKGKLSPVLYIVAVIATLRSSWIARAVLVIAAIIWLIPDRRIEKRLASSGG
jgi:hypothetical protein